MIVKIYLQKVISRYIYINKCKGAWFPQNTKWLLYFCDNICIVSTLILWRGPSWPWSYGSWIYNCICYQCLSPLMLWVRISIRARCTTLCDKVCQWFVTGRLFSPGPPVSSTNKTDRHDIAEILLKVALNTIKQTNKHFLEPRCRLIMTLKWMDEFSSDV